MMMQVGEEKAMSQDDMIPIIGIDIGGTLSKVSFACKKGKAVSVGKIDHLSSKGLVKYNDMISHYIPTF
jgi:predicted NBD/HSP70 family sugar kinase